jgi:multidrug efflux pump subunit AcrA (membrane-fusion protein)
VVPDSAIVLAGDTSVVFVVGPDSIAHQRTVVRGVGDDRRTEVRGDLKAGDMVVTTGAFGLQNGMRVVPSRNANPTGSPRP